MLTKTQSPALDDDEADQPLDDEQPLRAELFSVVQLEAHARRLAASHILAPARIWKSDTLLPRLAASEERFQKAYALVTDAMARGRRITPAAEWFVDNYPLIEEQIRTARRHLPRGYSRELPRLTNARVAGTPRVYDLALELISHSHGRVDAEALLAFVNAYQSQATLRLGELWAIPIMLRLALLENLRRVVAGITAGRRDRERATQWVARMATAAAERNQDVVLVLAEMVSERQQLSDAFVTELATRLQAQGPGLAIASAWLDQRLAERGQTLAHVFQLASQSQAADQVAIGNSIGSLRFLGAMDWRVFVESTSAVEAELRADPVHAQMDFETRDRYRHAVETLARTSPQSEPEIARAAVALARAHGAPPGSVQHHVGYVLIDDGLPALQRAVGAKVRWSGRVRRVGGRTPLAAYLALAGVLTVASTTWLFVQWRDGGVQGAWLAVGAGLLALATSQLALAIAQLVVTSTVPPRLLARMDFSHGIPKGHAALVAVPTLLSDAEEVDELLEALEVRFLANRDPHLAFALVTDFKDAKLQHEPGDEALLSRAADGIASLNERYAGDGSGASFVLLHRARRLNPREGVWMGWERKRGKIEDLNATLRGARDRFDTVVGDLERLRDTRYVIILDSDTQLPRDAARSLVATLAHPLNRPVYDEARERVVRGYSILQPRVDVSMASAACSRFAHLFAGDPGIDPYTRAVSDVYQDLCGEGSFVGKGIYDVDALQRAVGERFPENRVLSHDLLEGAYARCGLVSDVTLVEDHPTTHRADITRRARWIRGDWQIAAWLFPRPPQGPVPRRRQAVSDLSRWKIFDNLRRSLVAPGLLALLLLGWWLPGTAMSATLLAIGVALLPGVLAAAAALARSSTDSSRRRRAPMVSRDLARQVMRDLAGLAWLPIDAFVSLASILVATTRVVITRRHLLEWRTANDAARAARTSLAGAYLSSWTAPATAIAAAALVSVTDVTRLPWAAPFILGWVASPALSWWLSEPVQRAAPRLAAADVRFLRLIARRTWRFFETFVAAADNHLPPDNFQEDPPQGIAHRTSPTNIGLALTANLAAYDFGAITATQLAERTALTLGSLDKLQRVDGHFYNWYDTTTLEPLHPLYVSTVDSGNLAGHLLVLAAGLEEVATASSLRREAFTGLQDVLALVDEAWAARESSATPAPLVELRSVLAAAMPGNAEAAADVLARVASLAAQLPQDARSDDELSVWARALERQAAAVAAELRGDERAVRERSAALHGLATRCRAFAEMDVRRLYDPNRRLLSIGENVSEHRLDNSYYDLLASEARLASFVAIAQGQLPQEHWFALGRALTMQAGRPSLLSWSGSMFEYLMPLLVMPTYPRTLLDETYTGSVERQMEYGKAHGVPWGVSESGYLKTDAQRNYQYRAFGVPGLGLKRGLADDLVIAPYATALALMVDPVAACANLRRLAAEDQLGPYGFYEAVDYTTARLPPGKTSVTVRSFMAHHEGMTYLALAYLLLDQPMQRRFLADPALRATDLLLQERVPKTPPIFPHPAEVSPLGLAAPDAAAAYRVFTSPSTPRPEVHLLSNGQYHVAVTSSGGGYSRWRDLAVTRWREDPTRDCWGTFCYVKDVDTGVVWSTAHQPTLQRAKRYEAIFSPGRAEFRRTDGDIETYVEISVSPEDDVELRRVSITNRGRAAKTLDLTSYAEVVLAPAAADAAHPAFSNLFVQTELLREHGAILCTRRPRSAHETPPTLLHLMSVHGGAATPPSFETGRDEFVGRGRSVVDPIAMAQQTLSDSAGSVLDPVVAIRNRIVVKPHHTVQLHIVTGVAETRERALGWAEKYADRHLADRVLELSWTQSQVLMRRLDATDADAQLYERLASHVLYSNPALRAPEGVVARNRRGQSGLWGYGISGDLPIVLVRIGDLAEIQLVRHMLKAHMYWRLKGLVADLVVWNEDPSGYRQELHDQIMALVSAVGDANVVDKPGGVFVRRSEQMSEEDKVLLQTVARLIVSDTAGPLHQQLDNVVTTSLPPPLFPGVERRATVQSASTLGKPAPAAPTRDLAAFNGLGGFTHDGREYVITTSRSSRTPTPWVNVLANPWFGTVVSESGGAYTWCENAHSYRLTPWNNDPVSDASGEAFYLRDEEDGRAWSPTPLPAPGDGPYTTRHGFGYSVFETAHAGLATELTTFVATDAPLKWVVVKVKNQSDRARRLTLTGVFELVLGATRPANVPHVVSELDAKSGALFAHNAYHSELGERVAFLDASDDRRTVCGDRTEVIGRNGTAAQPAFLKRARLSGRVGARLDPCLAMQVSFELGAGQEREIAFTFGSGRDRADAVTLVHRFRGVGAAHDALARVWGYWNRTLGTVNVQTPDASLNFLANGWLLYQVLAARLWARSGFYQSGGAFGFRDQLQDTMALVHAEPALLREQIMRCASRQFREGDVQHWWHPPQGRGVRTRISDDYLWLPFATCRYVRAVGDTGVLDEVAPFLDGRPVKHDEDSYYDLPMRSEESGTLYEHCVRAVRHGLRFGAHGLPLMGTGDWNDGMNLVGDHGRGESVWLGFFLHDVLVQLEPIARARGDVAFADECVREAAKLSANLAEHGWDGAWYRRAYFDDGTPLGSAENVECQIDALPQSWAMLTGVGDRDRARQGMQAVNERLVKRELGVIQLFDPPFDGKGAEPGYVRGYVPGVRENGGQYTHAAVWTVMAFAAAGDVARAWELFGLINPVKHADDAQAMKRYKVEPYVVAADVYTNPQHAGRGGWTWYTGSAGWMYRLAVESLLGVHREVDHLRITPLVPAGWHGFEVHYRFHDTVHHIRVHNRTPEQGAASRVLRVACDDVEQPDQRVPLRNDGREHWVDVDVGALAEGVSAAPQR